MNQHEAIAELRERVARLEADRPARPRVYNQSGAAERLNMSVSKLQGELKAGRLTGRRSGRIWMFQDADLDAYIAAQVEGDA
jgi:excisionase family DNA binding protein